MAAFPPQMSSTGNSGLDPYYFSKDTPRSDAYGYVHYDSKGRLGKFEETAAQRRERVEFLRRREWTRRIAEWIEHSANSQELAHITHSWADILAAADAVDDLDDTASSPYTLEEPEPEPYIIYTASPRSGSFSCSIPSYTPPSPAHTLPSPAPRSSHSQPRRKRSGGLPRSRHSSLSSISEEEEAAAPCF
ncbi:uncharacterized protein FIBRA_02744 [Fibroporia radiculosa]|uniref:Uncharacterized protein n=1 Tax=Fibroporia radiculosa TaxID=599839 RepID=J4H209_9APHY|nr:uncharacterized protein FIBRA_02744 [Fibroporia radiculosa]CCM00704.1 predicted protein [Fibroporia radiculosa]